MTRLKWDAPGARYFETGVDRGVLYPKGEDGVAWNGLTSVSESPSGGSATPYYLDGVKYLNVPGPEDFAGSIEAYTYPREFAACDGSAAAAPGFYLHQQRRKSFGLSYRTRLGNDIDGVNHGYKLHLIYNALASPTEKTYSTLGENVEPISFSWGFTTTPVKVGGVYLRTAHVTLDSTRVNSTVMKLIEDRLYGTTSRAPTLLPPEELLILLENAPFRLEIVPNLGGLAQLLDTGTGDLEGFLHEGLYLRPFGSRLVETSTPGLYTLEP